MARIEDVAVFIEVAERGSFAQAARRLARSPAAVTRAVAELEGRLGVRLLTRTTRAGAVRRIIVASPAYLSRHGRPQTPADLAAHAVVAFSGIAGIERWTFRQGGRELNATITPRLVVNTAEAALDAARADFGMTRV